MSNNSKQFNGNDLSGGKILVVDDNLQNLELLLAYLDDLPCEITSARDGIEAMESIAVNVPDLILLDVMMPRMSGFEVCQKIKSNPETRHIAVVMVTALNEVVDYERAVECGTNDFITKPINKVELLARVESQLSLSMMRRSLENNSSIHRRVSLDGHLEGLDTTSE